MLLLVLCLPSCSLSLDLDPRVDEEVEDGLPAVLFPLREGSKTLAEIGGGGAANWILGLGVGLSENIRSVLYLEFGSLFWLDVRSASLYS